MSKDDFIKAARIAESYGPSRPLVSNTERSLLIQGRYEGEQAASSNIGRLIREEMNKPLVETQRILFLDIDGPICAPRAVMAQGAIGVTRYFDPVAVGFLNQLYIAAPYRIVVTSTWRKEVYMPIVLATAGILAPCHKDWATTEEEVLGTSSMDDRPYQINRWMDEQGILATNSYKADLNINPYEPADGVKCIILDDDTFNWHPWHKECWVKADCYDGIGLKAMQRAFDLWEVEWPAKNCAYPT